MPLHGMPSIESTGGPSTYGRCVTSRPTDAAGDIAQEAFLPFALTVNVVNIQEGRRWLRRDGSSRSGAEGEGTWLR